MNTVKSSLFLACGAACLLAGCAGQQQFQTVVREDSIGKQICVVNLEKRQVMQIAEEVLSEMYFTIAKADVESGIIRTRPLPGAQIFEFWRSDSIGAFNRAEANLHSIRRIVELDISRKIADSGQRTADSKKLNDIRSTLNANNTLYAIRCNVKTQRLNLPEREVASSSQAYRMFSASSPSMQKFELNPEQKKGMAWVDLGQDGRLETEILKRIEKRVKSEVRYEMQNTR